MTLRAVTLDQPYPTLIAIGAKWIETRGRRSPWHLAIGETIAVHAAVKQPRHINFGGWICEPRYRVERLAPVEPRIWRSTTKPGDLFGSHESRALPLGAVVATARVDAVIPMVAPDSRGFDEGEHRFIGPTNALDEWFLWRGNAYENEAERDVTDQVPFGDFAPGRWAILLEDVVKLAEPVYNVGGFHRGLWTVPPADEARIREQVAA